MKVELDVSELAVGMYVVEITQPKNKFQLAEQGWITKQQVIDGFKRKGIEKLLVDSSKRRPQPSEPAKVNQATMDKQAAQLTKTPGLFKQRLSQAKQLFNESKAIQRRLFDDAQAGVPLTLEPVRRVTDQSIEAIFDNPDALACVINIRHKDQYLLEHSVAVSVLMTIFACYLKIDKEIVSELAIGAFLHDVGKIMIPPSILDKPGRLTTEEFEVMKTHANHSIRIIENTPNISPLSLEVARLHHEKLNGKGYPFGVSAEAISRFGRMIAICDIFDALTANRCYKAGYPQVKAFSILRALGENNELDRKSVV